MDIPSLSVIEDVSVLLAMTSRDSFNLIKESKHLFNKTNKLMPINTSLYPNEIYLVESYTSMTRNKKKQYSIK